MSEFQLRFGGSLVEQLGAQLYPSATATVAELISNAWDADATEVHVTIPFGESWTADSEILVLDNGNGMTPQQAQDHYLVVGRRRRLEGGGTSEGGRPLHGRKGIGKLAAFGTARILECFTKRDGLVSSFRLDYDKIRNHLPGADVPADDVSASVELVDPSSGDLLGSGTLVRLTELRLKRALSEEKFMGSMTRRFSIDAAEMSVFINGTQLTRFSQPVEFQFPSDGVPPNATVTVADGWGVEEIGDGREVRWWLGFTEKPLQEEFQLGVSLLAHGKMAQRPFRFERSQGTTAQLGQEYLVGEVVADWLDDGNEIEDDLIQSNRDQLLAEDDRLAALLDWGRKRVAWALRKRQELRSDKAVERYKVSETLQDMLAKFTNNEKKSFLRIAKNFSDLPEVDGDQVDELMEQVINAHDDVAVRELIEQIELIDESSLPSIWGLVHQFGLVDARKTYSQIQARLATIAKLEGAIHEGAPEVPEIHTMVKSDPWLLDPRWDLLDDEVNISSLGVDFLPEVDDESGLIMDYLFVLQPRPPASIDEVVVVEIKRGSTSDGKVRKASDSEVNKFHQYVLGVQEHYSKSTERPRIRGLMIAQDFTAKGDHVRKSLEKIPDPQLSFRTWDRVIEDTKRMHQGWLGVSEKRLAAPSAIDHRAQSGAVRS